MAFVLILWSLHPAMLLYRRINSPVRVSIPQLFREEDIDIFTSSTSHGICRSFVPSRDEECAANS